ncbi:MAG TPA: hypothetical protein VFI24_23430 [Pyrinomonadaceae bacterium]|nr:hypothetical protein [Pyrinomonadaceae bacterium]
MPDMTQVIIDADNLREIVAVLFEADVYTAGMLSALLMPMYNAEIAAGRLTEEGTTRIRALHDQLSDEYLDSAHDRDLYLRIFEILTERRLIQRPESLEDISSELSPHNAGIWAKVEKGKSILEDDIRDGLRSLDEIKKSCRTLANVKNVLMDNVESKRMLKGLAADLDSDFEKGKIKPQRAARMRAIMAELEELLDAPLNDPVEIKRARQMRVQELLASISGAIAVPAGKKTYEEDTRAYIVDSFITDLKAAFIEELRRPGIREGEKDIGNAGGNVIGAQQTLEKHFSDEDVIDLEKETLRSAALELKQYYLRHHLMLITPVWTTPRSLVQDQNSVLFSGPAANHALVERVCKKRGLTLLSGQRAGVEHGRFRWQQLWTSHVSVFDLTGHDQFAPVYSATGVAAACYEIGIAFALGRSVVILAREGPTLPFDIDVAPTYLSGGDEDEETLGAAIDVALYTTQRYGGGSSLGPTLEYARRILSGEQEWMDSNTAVDPVQARRLLQQSLSKTGSRRRMSALAALPGAYPSPDSPHCFHVMPFRAEFNWTVNLISKICEEREITYVRGDRVLEADIIRSIWDEICRATHIVVELTGLNPNVVIELGIVHTLGRNVLIVTQDESTIGAIPSLAKVRVHLYSSDGSQGPESLTDVVVDFLKTSAELNSY